MGTLPNVTILESNGNLGRIASAEDSISGIIVTGIAVAPWALGDVLGPFNNIKDVEAIGIDAAYDTANSVLAHKHISDFFLQAGEGTELYVMVVLSTVTMTQMCDNTLTHAKKMLQVGGGRIKLLAISRVAAVGALLNQFEADLVAAVAKAQELREAEYVLHKPVQILLEGKMFQGTVSSAQDMRLLESNRVSVVIYQDAVTAALNAAYNKYASIGHALGRLAAQPVQRNFGRVKNGSISGITTPALSSGALMSTISDPNQETLNAKGLIFLKQHPHKTGFFINDAHTCAALTDDYAFITDGRSMDKFARIASKVYVEEILDDVEVDKTTGKLALPVIKNFQGIFEKAGNDEMVAKGEASAVSAFCDPTQNVRSTSKIKVKLGLLSKATNRQIEAEVGFEVVV